MKQHLNESRISVLLVEDDKRLATLITEYLDRNGFVVSVEHRGDRGRKRIIEEKPALVILDLMLPGLDGLSICREVRHEYQGPILMLTAREDDMDQVVGLEMGADDYVKKPIEPRVLLARIRALLRRLNDSGPPQQNNLEACELRFGILRINGESRTVFLADEEIQLTTGEFSLLWFLASNAGKTLDRETLFKEMRGIPYDGIDRSVDIGVSRLRKKLGDDANRPFRIKTVWGRGYLFVRDGWSAEGEK